MTTPPAQPKPPPPPGQWQDANHWTWKDAAVVGTGLDGKLHLFEFRGGQWVRVV